MSFPLLLRLLSFAIALTAPAGLAHASFAVDERAAAQAPSAPRAAEGGCTAAGQGQCHMLAVDADRTGLDRDRSTRWARFQAVNDPEGSRFAPALEDKPPRTP